MLRRLATSGVTVAAAIHSPTSYGFQLFDNLLILIRGRIVYCGCNGTLIIYHWYAATYITYYHNIIKSILSQSFIYRSKASGIFYRRFRSTVFSPEFRWMDCGSSRSGMIACMYDTQIATYCTKLCSWRSEHTSIGKIYTRILLN